MNNKKNWYDKTISNKYVVLLFMALFVVFFLLSVPYLPEEPFPFVFLYGCASGFLGVAFLVLYAEIFKEGGQ